jgi:hypothetical protein
LVVKILCLRKGKRWARRQAHCWSPFRQAALTAADFTPAADDDDDADERHSEASLSRRHSFLQNHLATPEGMDGSFCSL